MGVLKGNQTQLGYLYPKTTDFIFAVVGEEMGFIIACSVILLNILIIVKAVQIAKRMLKSGKLSYEEIAEFAELTVEEVKALDEKVIA